MDTWNRLIDLRVEGVERDWKKLAKECICIYSKPTDTDNNAVYARGGCWSREEKG